MSRVWQAEYRVWPDIFRLWCYGLMIALAFGFLGAVIPIGDSLAVFRIEFMVALGVSGLVALLSGRQVVGALALLICIWSGVSILPFALTDTPPDRVDLRLHQHNVLYGNDELDALIEEVRMLGADVLTFQEVSETNFKRLRAGLEEDFPHYQVCLYSKGGVAVMMRNRGALIDYGCLPKTRLAWMRIGTDFGPVTVGSVHQLWPWPMNQFEQARVYEAEIAELAGPIVLGGDFNNVPWSAAVGSVARAAGGRLASGLERSYLFEVPWPRLRIDHVIVPKGAKVSAALSPAWGSDHLGVTADIMLER